MTSFVIQFRELGGGGSFTTLTTLNTAQITNGNDATASSFSGTFTHTWSGQDNQFNDFDGFEYKVIATDAAGAVGGAPHQRKEIAAKFLRLQPLMSLGKRTTLFTMALRLQMPLAM